MSWKFLCLQSGFPLWDERSAITPSTWSKLSNLFLPPAITWLKRALVTPFLLTCANGFRTLRETSLSLHDETPAMLSCTFYPPFLLLNLDLQHCHAQPSQGLVLPLNTWFNNPLPFVGDLLCSCFVLLSRTPALPSFLTQLGSIHPNIPIDKQAKTSSISSENKRMGSPPVCWELHACISIQTAPTNDQAVQLSLLLYLACNGSASYQSGQQPETGRPSSITFVTMEEAKVHLSLLRRQLSNLHSQYPCHHSTDGLPKGERMSRRQI